MLFGRSLQSGWRNLSGWIMVRGEINRGSAHAACGVLYPRYKRCMALTITSRVDRNIQILTLVGNLTLGLTLQNLQRLVRSALEAPGIEALLLDVAGVKFADSAGLGELTVVYSLCSRKQCPVILVGVPLQLRGLLELTRLDVLLRSVPDIEVARRLLKPRSQRRSSGELRGDGSEAD